MVFYARGTPPMPRLFFAIPIDAPPPLRRVLDELHALRGSPVRFGGRRTGGCAAPLNGLRLKPVDPANLHLTLRFLGDADAARIPDLAAALDRAVAAVGVPAFDLAFTTVAALPPRGLPRVLVADVADPAPLFALEQSLTAELSRLTPPFPPDQRPFRPHLTLARLAPPQRRGPRPVAPPIDLHTRFTASADASRPLGRARITALHLIESAHRPTGPIYMTRHASNLTR